MQNNNNDRLYIYHNNEIKDSVANKDSVLNRYRLQFYADGDCYPENYEVSEKDLDFGLYLINLSLNIKGYKPVSDAEFYNKLNDIFGIVKNDISNCDYINQFHNFLVYLVRFKYTYMDAFSIGNNHLYISTKYKFISNMPLMVWYSSKTENDNLELVILDVNYHRNQYFFHNSQSSLAWLIQNDIEFLELLVKEFGYDKDEKLNKAVIRFVYDKYKNPPVRIKPTSSQDESQMRNFFARKNNEGRFIVHEGIMKTIVNMTTLEDVKYLKWLNFAGIMLGNVIRGSEGSGGPEIFGRFSQQECLKLMAYVCYYIETAYIKNNITGDTPEWYRRTTLSIGLIDIPQFLPFLEENNYFDLPDYEEMIRYRLQEYKDLWG